MRGIVGTVAVCAALALAACGEDYAFNANIEQPTRTNVTDIGRLLNELPPPKQKVDVAVYAFEDRTGQQRPAEGFSSFSRAVGQASDAILIDVLTRVSNKQWFTVVERVGVQNLLNERTLIDQTNQMYLGTTQSTLPPLRFAGMILEGGVVDYDTNVMTGGSGARLLGVGSSTQYRRDVVTVALRAVSVNTGEVLTSVTTEKTVYSVLVASGLFAFVSSDAILELETGYSRNEPVGLAVRQAIELAVYSLIVEGATDGLWQFRDRKAGQQTLQEYYERFGLPALQVASR